MKIIAFYLPQFHAIPENDKFWGKGFTEWVNVKNAKPLFDGHEQPVVPYKDNYYNLLDQATLKWQVEIANEYGVYGFCFYHYWIEGKMLLEKPVELFLKDKTLNQNFCLSWANHTWTDSWQGSHKTLIAQTYGGKEDWSNHFNYLLQFFKDSRYIKYNNKPLLLIFNPEDIPDLNDMLDYWQQKAKESGFNGISFAYQNYYFGIKKNKDDSRFELGVEHQPAYAFYDYRNKLVMATRQYGYKFLSFLQRKLKVSINMDVTKLEIMDYDRLWSCILNRMPTDSKRVPGAFSGWDSTPRKKEHGLVVTGATPEKFKYYLIKQIRHAREDYHKDMIFVAAWNEWAEGSMLEPTEKDGYAYLNAIREALVYTNEFEQSKG